MPTYDDRIDGVVRWQLKDYASATITLYEEDYSHIIEHHQNMKRNEHAIKETVSDPDSVYRDRENETRRVYFKNVRSATYAAKVPYTAVIVEGADRTWTDARVVTAFPRKKEGGAENDILYRKDQEQGV